MADDDDDANTITTGSTGSITTSSAEPSALFDQPMQSTIVRNENILPVVRLEGSSSTNATTSTGTHRSSNDSINDNTNPTDTFSETIACAGNSTASSTMNMTSSAIHSSSSSINENTMPRHDVDDSTVNPAAAAAAAAADTDTIDTFDTTATYADTTAAEGTTTNCHKDYDTNDTTTTILPTTTTAAASFHVERSIGTPTTTTIVTTTPSTTREKSHHQQRRRRHCNSSTGSNTNTNNSNHTTYTNTNITNNNNNSNNNNNNSSNTGNSNNNHANSGSSSSSSGGGPSDAIRRVTRVSRHAAMTTKQAVWDSNELSIDAALSAVDQWESAYTAFRSLLVHTVVSARGLYGTAKDGVNQLEHGLLIPVRDWILLPAFTGAEKAVAETTKFLQSPAARQLAHNTLQLASSVPVIGENVLAPTMKLSVVAIQRTWDVLQYPIPSREQVRSTVDWSLTGTKWALTAAGREIFLYAKRADANITRTLSHTQWKVLGSGPYTTLDASNRSFVIDHSCERYFAQSTDVARYELAAHIRRHNPALYFDLVVTGLLKERGGDITENDEWLSPNPIYRDQVWDDDMPFLLPNYNDADDIHRSSTSVRSTTGCSSTKTKMMKRDTEVISALWFRWPHVNGSPPAKDAPWICFRRNEQYALERKYREVIQNRAIASPSSISETVSDDEIKHDMCRNNNAMDANTGITERDENNLNSTATPKQTNCLPPRFGNSSNPSYPPTIAQWYTTNPSTDVLVDQQRYSVVFSLCCSKCRKVYDPTEWISPLLASSAPQYGDVCASCQMATNANDKLKSLSSSSSSSFVLPPISTVMRPNFWRFYGHGDDVRRATWFLDTARNGLQPFDYEAQAVLEDAYLFLRWLSYRRTIDPDKKRVSCDNSVGDTGMDESLLTVEVPGPDGTDRLVQFSSLTQATAIQKGLGAAIALFKRRVYRGAWLETIENVTKDIDSPTDNFPLDDCNAEPILPEVMVSDESLRSLLIPPAPIVKTHSNISLEKLNPEENKISEDDSCLAVPRERMKSSDMVKLLRDERDGSVDHLCLIVHGIGEMMRSVDLFGLTLPNLSAVCGSMRNNHAEAQAEHLPQIYPKADMESSLSSAAIGRVEYLPVEWHEAFSILTQRRSPLPDVCGENANKRCDRGRESPRNVMIEDISLKTIPNMREFANDTLMDVLFFMNPEHHQIIVDVVTSEMNLGTKYQCTHYLIFCKID
jgi:hypothetical protein